jgi:hypothetical protein
MWVHRSRKHHFLTVIVDDLLLAVPDDDARALVLKELNSHYVVNDLGLAKHYAGLHIEQDVERGLVSIDTTHFIEELVRKLNLQDMRKYSTPAASDQVLSKSMVPTDPEELERAKQLPFMTLVGALRWIVDCCRFDAAWAVREVAKFLRSWGKSHYQAAVRILSYLYLTKDFRLIYRRKSEFSTLTLSVYTDADWARDIDSSKSVFGYMLFVNGQLIEAKSKSSATVQLSTCESERGAMFESSKSVMQRRLQLDSAGFTQSDPTPIYTDSQSAVKFICSNRTSYRARHIRIHKHFLRELMTNNTVKLVWIPGQYQLADILTKPLPADRFQQLRTAMGITLWPG